MKTKWTTHSYLLNSHGYLSVQLFSFVVRKYNLHTWVDIHHLLPKPRLVSNKYNRVRIEGITMMEGEGTEEHFDTTEQVRGV